MYYKVLKNGRAIDALDRLQFVKYQPKHGIMVNCTEDDAQGIISSNGKYIWHVDGNFGAGTKAKLIEYQKAHGLTADGICGPGTWGSFT